MIYLVTGAGGAGLYNAKQEDDPASWQPFTHKFISPVHSLTVADVNGPTLDDPPGLGRRRGARPVPHYEVIEGATAMLGTAAADRPTTAAQSARNAGRSTRLGAFDILVLSAWLGLTAGLVEVGTTVLCRAINPTDRLYLVSRHFLWVTPLANLASSWARESDWRR